MKKYKIKKSRRAITQKVLFLALAIIFFVATGLGVHYLNNYFKTERSKPIVSEEKKDKETPKTVAEEPPKPVIKESALINVPYTVQAPLVNWNIHEQSCEEASVLMTHYFLTGSQVPIIQPASANQELIDMVNWQKKNYGKESDLNMYAVGKLAQDYYGYKYQVTEDITADNIKQAISNGNPVLVPVITHALRNPHYGPNPSYHILLIKGYNPSGIITNDAGVKEGKDYFYTWDVLWQAIDAQTSKMNQGRDMLVITK